jgi:uncharacterized protein (DUF1778 family)
MLAFVDTTAPVRESKSARLEQRTKPRVKETIERAAASLGVDTSDFVTSAAYQQALQTLEAQQRTALDSHASIAFFAAIDSLSEPTDAMKRLMADYEACVESAIR